MASPYFTLLMYRETIARVTGGMKVKADRDEVSLKEGNSVEREFGRG